MPECNGWITTVDETAQFAPGKNPNEPTFVITDVGIENGTMYAFIIGGWPEGYPGWIKDSLYVGEPKHVPTIGTFTLLDITTAQAVYGHGSATFCFEPDLNAYITHWNTTRRQVKLKGLTPAEYRDQTLREAA